MYTAKSSTIIVNGINPLGLELAKSLDTTGEVIVIGETSNSIITDFPKSVSIVENELFSKIKFSKIKKFIVLYHEKIGELVSATDLSNHAKYLSDIFQIATNNKAQIVITTSFSASRHYTFAKYNDKDRPYDFPSFQNFIEKLALEQSRRTPTYVLRLGDLYGEKMTSKGVIYRIIKDALDNNSIRVDDDGLEKLFPISNTYVAHTIKEIHRKITKSGVYTLAPQTGITQMAFANMCMEYSNNVSHLQFVKSKYNSYPKDLLYENIYIAAPYIPGTQDNSKIETELPVIIKSLSSQVTPKSTLKKEKEGKVKKYLEMPVKKDIKAVRKLLLAKRKYMIFGLLFLTLIFLIITPLCFLVINTKLLTSSVNIFFNNYDKSLIAEVSEDAKYNYAKSISTNDSLHFTLWLLPILGDDLKSNENFLNAEMNYFEALTYSNDYNFLSVSDTSRSIIQLKLQNARALIKNVDKTKLFWDLENQYTKMKDIIENANL